MSAIITIPGRPTADPQLMQAKNSGSTYTNLDIPVTQRGQDGNKETIFYNCHFNSFQADRLMKAGVKKRHRHHCLWETGASSIHPFKRTESGETKCRSAGDRVRLGVRTFHL